MCHDFQFLTLEDFLQLSVAKMSCLRKKCFLSVFNGILQAKLLNQQMTYSFEDSNELFLDCEVQ